MAARIRLPLLFLRNSFPFRSQSLVHTEVGVKEPTYPPIVPSITAKSKSARRRQVEEHVQKIRASSVQDKLSLITRIQRMKFVVYPQTFARNADRWYQHFTKTAFIPALPEKFTPGSEKPAAVPGIDDDAFADIRSLVTRAILHEHWEIRKRKSFMYRHQEQVVGPFLRTLVSGLTYSLAKYNPLLRLSSLDLSPQVNFYWRRGQRIIPKGHRRGHLEPTRFQIDDHPHSQIRVTQQLPQFTPLEASYAAEVPEITFAPNVMPLFRRQYDNNIFTASRARLQVRSYQTRHVTVTLSSTWCPTDTTETGWLGSSRPTKWRFSSEPTRSPASSPGRELRPCTRVSGTTRTSPGPSCPRP
ncbi:large ribosomal subunit protein mL65 isoform X2 [Archocentrus centrarchus]|uniref:large ribosomal subunit protein mL65 isoform X2 n=1 Tax=Archocentrus centrarchus TaxID=63155 RepID=UPI0011E9EAC9|nr:39S ribosomal protein S30, mitochondrial isoform X2 [Archocentrus centrarchus]